jgi:diguanylate cyclase (GGDEF)-like protein/PAS domain S-box-containing protein
MSWGLLLLAALMLIPRDFALGSGWVSLHTLLELISVVVSAMLFMVGRNALILNKSRAGAYVGSLFLLVAVLDTGHLLSFSGMPDWLTASEPAKSISFWLAARLVAAIGLLVCVSLDWSKPGGDGVRYGSLALVVAAGAVLVPGAVWFAVTYPRLLWAYPGLTPAKIVAEGVVIVLMLAALTQEIRRRGLSVPYQRRGMVFALLTLITAEWCFVGYEKSNDAFMLVGHIYKAIGYLLLYRTLVSGMIREPYRRLREAEAVAARKGEEMEAIFLSVPDGVILVGEDGNILKVNPRFTQLTGYEEVAVVGRAIDILIPERFRSDHRDLVRGFMQAPQTRSMAAGRELYARRRDGSEFPVDISLSPVMLDGKRCVIATLRDVSERTAMHQRLIESQARIRSFLDNSVDWVWEIDSTGMLTYSSQRVLELLGYTPEEALGRNFLSFMAEGDAAQLGPQLREIIVRREPMLHLEHRNRTQGGEMRLMETDARPFFGVDGRFLGYRGITRDVTQQRELQKALQKSERVFRHAFEDFPSGMAFVDSSGVIQRCNAFLSQLLGYEPGELDGQGFSQLLPIDMRWTVSRAILKLCEGRTPLHSAELLMLRKNGQLRWVRLTAAMIEASSGSMGPLLLMITDIAAEKEAASHNDRLLAIIERMGDTVAVADRNGKCLYLNPYGRGMLGIDAGEDLQNTSIEHFYPPATAQLITNRALPLAEKNGTWEGETTWRSRNGEDIVSWQSIMVHRDATGKIEYWTTIARDIRERKQMEERLSLQATHDALTGLPNRLLMRDRLQQAMGAAKRDGKLMAVIFVDLDNFKRINDTLGHNYGDLVLVESASRLRDSLRGADTLARQGGDEFIVLLPGLNTMSDVVGIVEKMATTLGQAIMVDGREIYVTASFGVSIYPFDHDDVDELLRKADVAMYRAKELGRNGYQFYTSDMDERFNEDLSMEVDLRRALENDELFLHYQPKVSLATREVVGFEALVRWRHPRRGVVSPAEFIPIAERSLLIAHLGEWVLREACRQICLWRGEGLPALPVAVNISAQQFEYMDVARLIRQVLTEYALDGALLEVEITEGVLMRDPLATTRTLAEIKGLGVNIAVDDFGTGYSSLGYLKQFPVDVLKIDRSFVKEVHANDDDAAIVRAIVSMAHNLDISVVAEGVETVEQLGFLDECACDFVQGYLFGKPVAPDEAVRHGTCPLAVGSEGMQVTQ